MQCHDTLKQQNVALTPAAEGLRNWNNTEENGVGGENREGGRGSRGGNPCIYKILSWKEITTTKKHFKSRQW